MKNIRGASRVCSHCSKDYANENCFHTVSCPNRSVTWEWLLVPNKVVAKGAKIAT